MTSKLLLIQIMLTFVHFTDIENIYIYFHLLSTTVVISILCSKIHVNQTPLDIELVLCCLLKYLKSLDINLIKYSRGQLWKSSDKNCEKKLELFVKPAFNRYECIHQLKSTWKSLTFKKSNTNSVYLWYIEQYQC